MPRYRLISPAHRAEAQAAVGEAPHGAVVTIKESTRTLEQNSRLWAMLAALSRAKPNGLDYDKEDWKILVMHAMKREMRLAPSLDGRGVVPLGYRSSQLSIAECSDLMEWISAYAAEAGVDLGEPA